MAGYESLLPVTEEKRLWVDDGFARLSKALGRKRMLEAKVILPTPEFFPDPYDGSDDAIDDFFFRLCDHMGVEYDRVELEIVHDPFEDESASDQETVNSEDTEDGEQETDGSEPSEERDPVVWRSGKGCVLVAREDEPSRFIIPVFWLDFDDTFRMAARIAHNLGHVILIGGNLIEKNFVDIEPLTDLLTVFLGMGVFNANLAMQFVPMRRLRSDHKSVVQMGWLAEETYGYALAKFAMERGEENPEWVEYLSTNVREYYKRSREWLWYTVQNESNAASAS